MKQYQVAVSPKARQQIGDCALYIAQQSGSLEVADRWIDRVYDSIQTLSTFPHRFVLGEENEYRDYEIRRKLIGRNLALHTIDEEAKVVRIIHFRHGSRLPRPGELPGEPTG